MNVKQWCKYNQWKEKFIFLKNKLFSMKKTMKIKLFIIFIILLIFILLINYLSNPIRVVNKFKQAIVNEKTDILTEIVVGREGVKLEELDFYPVINFFKNKPEALEILNNQLTIEAELYKKNKLNRDKNYEGKKSYFLIKTFDFLGIKKYKISFKEKYINLESKVEKAKIYLNEKEINEVSGFNNGKMKIGPLVPGLYNLKAISEEPYKIENKKTINFMEGNYSEEVIRLFSDSYTIKINSNKKGYKLFINNKEMEWIEEFDSIIGPLEGEIEMVAIYNDGEKEIKTEKIKVNEYTSEIYLEF